ncbi:MAG: asparagine synthase (glutamine-hydrolyzing) [Burkholderiales bacterium]
MCGIAGCFAGATNSGVRPTDVAGRMADALVHRGPDDRGVWEDEAGGLALAHRRLSIVDLSAAGHQPMVSASGAWVMAFNGEIYNHAAIRQELESFSLAPRWRGHSDTETVLAAVEAWGIEAAIARCVGMFAIALWNRDARELTLLRDRVGEKPLYWGFAGNDFLFASELKAFRAHPAWTPDIDRGALALFFRFGCVPAPHAIYRRAGKLLPGTLLTLNAHSLRHGTVPAARVYWHAPAMSAADVPPAPLPDAEAIAQLEELCTDAVRQQVVADVPLGAFLSGGVDSSTIVALMQNASSRRVQTFTVGFAESGFNEANYAREVARFLGTEHTEIYVSPEQARAVVPLLPSIYDEPFADSSQIPTFLVAQLARRHVTVALSGDGGDELFGGYNRYFLGRRLWGHLRRLPLRVRVALARAIGSCPPRMLDAMAAPVGLLVPSLKSVQVGDKAYKFARILSQQSDLALYRRLVSHWDDPGALVIGGQEPATVLDRLIDAGRGASEFEQWMMSTDIATYLPDDILVKVDRASMAVSLECRAPFLDHRVVEFASGLPLIQKIRQGQSKWLLRQVLYKHVPKALIERPKMGFGVPVGTWLRGPLREWADALMSEARMREQGFLDASLVRKKWSEHLSGARNWHYYLWDVLMFQAWLEREAQPTSTQ